MLRLLGHYLGGRRGIILLALAAARVGLYLGWGWLAAVGHAPLLLALAPCAAMCALGLCMNKGAANPAPRTQSQAMERKQSERR